MCGTLLHCDDINNNRMHFRENCGAYVWPTSVQISFCEMLIHTKQATVKCFKLENTLKSNVKIFSKSFEQEK